MDWGKKTPQARLVWRRADPGTRPDSGDTGETPSSDPRVPGGPPTRSPVGFVGAAVAFVARPRGIALAVFALALALAALTGMSGALAAPATTFAVTSTADSADVSVGDGACRTAANTCTLRAAIQEANASGAADTIHVPASSNKGDDSILKVMSKSGNALRALVRFALPATPQGCVVDTATLRLYAASSKSGRTLQTLRVAGSWSEGSVTWGNQPQTSGDAATTSSGSGWREWSVGTQVSAMYGSAGNHGFLVRDASESDDHEQQFHATEKGENVPQLVVRFKPAG